jgi:hypothetical protein
MHAKGKGAALATRGKLHKPAITVKGDLIEVRVLSRANRKLSRGNVSIALARDARRYGQDLVSDLIERAMREAEIQCPSPSRRRAR